MAILEVQAIGKIPAALSDLQMTELQAIAIGENSGRLRGHQKIVISLILTRHQETVVQGASVFPRLESVTV